MSESEEELQRREAQARAERQDAILDEDAAGTFIDCGPIGSGDAPPPGDLPDNPAPPPPSLLSRIRRALRGS